jgi:hypothetical protein
MWMASVLGGFQPMSAQISGRAHGQKLSTPLAIPATVGQAARPYVYASSTLGVNARYAAQRAGFGLM